MGLFIVDVFFDNEQLFQHAPGTAQGGQATVAIVGPIDGKFLDIAAHVFGPHDGFDIKHKAIGETLGVEAAGDIAPIDLETALGIGVLGGDMHKENCQPVKQEGANAAVPVLGFEDMAAGHFSGAVGDVALAVFDQVDAPKGIIVGDTITAVGEHDIIAAGGEDTCPDGMALTVVLIVADDLQGNFGGGIALTSNFGHAVGAAIIDDNNFSLKVMPVEESGRFEDVFLYLRVFV